MQQQLFAASGELSAAQKAFIEAYKRATFGADEKQLTRQLNGWLSQHADIFLEVPEAARWGRRADLAARLRVDSASPRARGHR